MTGALIFRANTVIDVTRSPILKISNSFPFNGRMIMKAAAPIIRRTIDPHATQPMPTIPLLSPPTLARKPPLLKEVPPFLKK